MINNSPGTKYDIIIIGAGAAGLIAMKDLQAAGYHVCLLEASPVAGGRIATIKEESFNEPVESGAEFIHGKLPLTLQLLNEANILYEPVAGKMINVQKGTWQEEEEHNKLWELFMHQLGELKTDMTISEFLKQYFSAHEFADLRKAVQRFAEGFDLADIDKASVLSIRSEWLHENETQYRISGGYLKLIDFLLEACHQTNAAIHFNACVYKIEYNNEQVKVYTTDNREFKASKLIITVSAGVLQSGDLEFVPALTTQADAIQQLGFGDVIKILLQFKSNFWKKHSADIGFLLSDEEIPTWWTQLPAETNLLTGWLGGPKAKAKATETDDSLLLLALKSLSSVFHLPLAVLKQELVHHKIICWHNQPYVKGGYSYNTTSSALAKSILSRPVNDAIFLAGEAMFDGDSQGTVEAALQSGRAAAKMVKDYLGHSSM